MISQSTELRGSPSTAMRLCIRSLWIVAALMATASAIGLASDRVYRDNALVTAGWWGTDLVTLLLGVPLTIGSTVQTVRRSLRGTIVSMGMLAYAAYNYCFYLFGAAFNSLFLVYVGVLSFSTIGLITGLASPELGGAVRRIRIDRSDRAMGWLVILVAAVLGLFWITSSVISIVSGVVPDMVRATDHPTNVTGALDLWLVVTFGLLGGTWLIRARPWGFVVSAVWTVKGAVYMTALSAASVSAYSREAADSLAQVGLWIPIGLACLVGAGILLRPSGPLRGAR